MAERAVLRNVPEVLQTALPALPRSNDEFVRLVLRLSSRGAFAFSRAAKFQTRHREADHQLSKSEENPSLDKEYNEEVLRRKVYG